MRKPIFLPPPLDAGNPFRVGRALTICAAAMVYACRHPYGKFLRDGSVGDYEDFIRTNQTSWNAYCDLMRRAERGSLPLKKAVYLRDGRLDPRRTRITFEVLLELARERGDADARLVELAQRAPSAGGTRATSGAQKRCEHWLKGLPVYPTPLKDDVRAAAKRQPFGKSLSDKGFDRAWANAAHAEWKRPGPKARRARKRG